MTKYKVESRVPIPGPAGRSPREGTSEFVETILSMAVGDSFIYKSYSEKGTKECRNDSANVHNMVKQMAHKRGLIIKIQTRTLIADGGGFCIRIWKTIHQASPNGKDHQA